MRCDQFSIHYAHFLSTESLVASETYLDDTFVEKSSRLRLITSLHTLSLSLVGAMARLSSKLC